jgi:hypothetical protein
MVEDQDFVYQLNGLACGFQQFSKEMQYNNGEKCSLSDYLQFVISKPFTPT